MNASDVGGQVIELLIIDDSLTGIYDIKTTLRRDGYLVHARTTIRAKEIQQVLEARPPDLLFYSVELEEPSLTQVREMVLATGRDIPVIALMHKDRLDARSEYMKAGARDLIPARDLDLLSLVTRRELDDLMARRSAVRGKEDSEIDKERCQNLLDNSRDAVAYIHEGAHAYVNSAYLSVFGYESADELTGLPVMNLVIPEDRARLKSFLRRFLSGDHSINNIEINGLSAGQEALPLTLELSPATVDGESCTQLVIRNVSPHQKLEEKIAELHRQDMLTGLANRINFQKHLEEAQHQALRGARGGAVLYIAIDNYRGICDRYGHEAGDHLVVDAAKLLRGLLDKETLLARISDSVFVALTPNPSSDAAEHVAETMLRAVEAYEFKCGNKVIKTTCCIGICMLGEHPADAGELIANAQHASMDARVAAREGKGSRVTMYREDGTYGVAWSQDDPDKLVTRIIADGRVALLFQPIVSLRGDTTERFEASIAIRGDQGQYQTPEEAFPDAESAALRKRLDKWAIAQSVQLLAESAGKKRRLTLFLSLSAGSILDNGLGGWLEEYLPSENELVLQIAEDLAEQHFRHTHDLVQRLRSLNCGLALSEFGGEQNSERLMRQLKPGYIKFRSVLVEGISWNDFTRKYVDTLSEEIRCQDGEAIAGSVRNAQQLADLWQTRLGLIQGDFVQRPSPNAVFDFARFSPHGPKPRKRSAAKVGGAD